MSPDINLLPDDLRRREESAPPSRGETRMHEPATPLEDLEPASRRKDPSTSLRTGFFKLFHREPHEEPLAPPPEPELPRRPASIPATPPPTPSLAPNTEPPTPPNEPAWHDVPDESHDDAPPQVDLIPGVVRGISDLRTWIVILSIGAAVLLLIVIFTHLALRRAVAGAEQERLFERERIAALAVRLDEIERASGGSETFSKRLKLFEERIASHRDWRKLFTLFEQELFPEVTLLQLRADSGGVVVVEARTTRVDLATSQARHLESALGDDASVMLGDVRVVAPEGGTQPFVQFRITLTLTQNFWK